MIRLSLVLGVCLNLLGGALFHADSAAAEDFPSELVDFVTYQGNPVFAGTGKDTWDRNIRERGYILKEGSTTPTIMLQATSNGMIGRAMWRFQLIWSTGKNTRTILL